MSNELLGIVVRYSDTVMGNQVDTIGEHNKIIEQTGAVYVGKFGKSMGKKSFEIFCTNDSRIKLILVKRTPNNNYMAYQAGIESAQKKRPRPSFIPPYLRKKTDINCWFQITGPLKLIPQKNLNKWVTKSSGRPLIETLHTSMSGLFYAIYNKEAKFKPRIGRKWLNRPKGKGSKEKKDCRDYQIDAFVENDYISLDEGSFEGD
jgi:hypothetical protein